MKKVMYEKIILISVIFIMIANCNVKAANDDGFNLILESSNSSSNTSNTSSNTSGNTSNISSNTSNSTNNTTNTVNKTNTSSNYTNKTNTVSNNSTNLPKTGVEDSIPTVLIVTILGASAVYAYKKINDYKDL